MLGRFVLPSKPEILAGVRRGSCKWSLNGSGNICPGSCRSIGGLQDKPVRFPAQRDAISRRYYLKFRCRFDQVQSQSERNISAAGIKVVDLRGEDIVPRNKIADGVHGDREFFEAGGISITREIGRQRRTI